MLGANSTWIATYLSVAQLACACILLYPVLPSPSFLRKQESIRVFALSTSLIDSCFRRNDGLGSYRYPLDDDWQEQDWLLAAASNPAFEYLREASEDVYSLEDGKPISDQD